MISTTRLADKYNLTSKDLFRLFEALSFIKKENNGWTLEKKGVDIGGIYQKVTGKNVKYITWPIDTNVYDLMNELHEILISATDIGLKFKTNARKINKIISELGWIEQHYNGWRLTKHGESIGGYEFESSNGTFYVKWSKNVLFDRSLNAWFNSSFNSDDPISSNKENLNKKYPPKYYTQDGHKVRSLSEKNIDDYLYMNGIVHAYEKTISTPEGDLIPDFYIPAGVNDNSGRVYIEFWGMNSDDYNERKKQKLSIYKKNDFIDNLIQLEEKHLSDLDSHLGKMLLKVGKIQVK